MNRLSVLLLALLAVSNVVCPGGQWKEMDPSDLPNRVLVTVYQQFSSRMNMNLMNPFEIKMIDNLKCQTVAGKNCIMVVRVENEKNVAIRFAITFWWKLDQSVEVQNIKQMLDGQYIPSSAKQDGALGEWREYSTDELPLSSLESAWNQFEQKVNLNVAQPLGLENIDSIWCQTVAGKKCKMTVTLTSDSKSHKFTIVFWIKLDYSVELMEVIDQGENKKESPLKTVLKALGGFKPYTFEQLGSDIETQFNKGMTETMNRTNMIGVTIGKSQNLRCQIIAGTKCLVDVTMTWYGEQETVEFMFWIKPNRSVEVLGFKIKE